MNKPASVDDVRKNIAELEKLHMTKEHVYIVLDAIADYWKKRGFTKNMRKIALITGLKLSLSMNNDKDVEDFWKLTIKTTTALQTLNGLAHLNKTMKNTSTQEATNLMVNNVAKMIKSGELFET